MGKGVEEGGRTGREDYSMEEFWSAQGRAVWKVCFSKGVTVSAVM